jgi:hypothetical protein
MKTYMIDNGILDAYRREEADRLRKAKKAGRIFLWAFVVFMMSFITIVFRYGVID